MLVACVRRAAAELSASSTLTRALHVSPMAAAKAKGPKKGAEEKEVRDAIPHPRVGAAELCWARNVGTVSGWRPPCVAVFAPSGSLPGGPNPEEACRLCVWVLSLPTGCTM